MARDTNDGLYIDLEYYYPEEYYVYIAEAEARLGYYYIEPDYIDYDYYDDQEGGVFSISCELTEVVGELKEASADLSVAATASATGSKQGVVEVDFVVTATSSTDNTRIRDNDVALTAVFSPTMTVFATRSGDIDLVVQASQSTQAERSRDTDVTLSTLINLSLQSDRIRSTTSNLAAAIVVADTTADITRTTSSSMSAVFASSADVERIVDASVSITSAFTPSVSANVFRFVEASADLSSAFSASANAISYVPNDYSPRPVNWVTTSRTTFDSTVKKYGTHSLRFDSTSTLPAFIQSDNPTDYFNIESGENFALEFWWRYDFGDLTASSTIFTYTPNFYIENIYSSAFQQNSLKLNFYGNTIQTDRLNSDVFHHISVVRSNGTIYFRVNQVSAGTISDSRAIVDDNDYIEFRATQNPLKTFYVDEFALRVSETTVNGYTQAPVNTDPTTTLMLTHFDNTYDDDLTGFTIDFAADLGVQASATTDNTRILGASADLGVQANIPIITPNAIINLSSGLTTQASIDTALTGFLKDASISTDAIASSISVAYRVADFFIDVPISATLSAEPEVTRITSASSSSAFTLETDVNEIVQLSADLAFAATAEADPTGSIIRTDAVLASYSGVSVEAIRIQQLSSNVLVNASLTSDPIISVGASANLNSAFTISADNARTRESAVDLDGFASTLTVAVKVGDYLVDIPVSASLSVDANTIPEGSMAAQALFTQSTNAVKTTQTSSALQIETTQTVEAIAGIAGEADFASATTLSADAVKITETVINIQGAAQFNTTVRATRSGDIDLYADAALVAQAGKITQGSAAVENTAQLSATISKVVDLDADLAIETALSADGNLIVLPQELTYVIPRETREYTILAETREFAIDRENREYTILGG